MPIFGQVWLWSLLAFLIGALLMWVLVVLPIRKRIYALERRLATIRAESASGASTSAPERPVGAPAPPAAPPPPTRSTSQPAIVPGFGDFDSQDEIRAESLTRAYAMPGILDAPPSEDAEERGALRLSPDTAPPASEPPGEATEYLGSSGTPLVAPRQAPDAASHGWFEDERDPVLPAPRSDQHLVDDADAGDEDERGTIFTQRTMPIPVDLIRQLDETGKAEAATTPAEDASLVDDLEDEPEEAPPAAEEPAPQPSFSGADTVVVRRNGVHSQPEPEPEPEPEYTPEPTPEPVAPERQDERIALVANNKNTMRAPIIELNKPLELDRQPSSLPKRIPSKPQHRHPFGVQTVSPAVTTPAPVAADPDTGSERMRSLFEPVIPAESTGQQAAVLPPPHRLQSTDSRPSAPGPFGPGSAMPLPGGASPSPEFTVKASVTALRYCTPESPQFGKTVAEVWFRSASDAERVGFRPVG